MFGEAFIDELIKVSVSRGTMKLGGGSYSKMAPRREMIDDSGVRVVSGSGGGYHRDQPGTTGRDYEAKAQLSGLQGKKTSRGAENLGARTKAQKIRRTETTRKAPVEYPSPVSDLFEDHTQSSLPGTGFGGKTTTG